MRFITILVRRALETHCALANTHRDIEGSAAEAAASGTTARTGS
jgi:hypothetical protein